VITAIDDDSLVLMRGVDILMTPAVNAGDFGSTPFAVHEIDRLPNTVAPSVIANSKRPSQRVSGFDHVGAGGADLRKVQHLVLAQGSGGGRDGFGEDNLVCLLVNHREL